MGAMWEARGGLAKALEHREKALELMSKVKILSHYALGNKFVIVPTASNDF